MPLDPAIAALVEFVNANPLPPVDAMPAAQFRELCAQPMPGTVAEPVANVIDTTLAGFAGAIPVRVYTPAGDGPFPMLLFYHGGGFVICNLETHDALARVLCNVLGAVVVSVDYRLAPEHRFPAAADDAFAALRGAVANAAQWNADASRIIVAGDSAGGNLAAVTCLMARDRSGPAIAAQLLFYPMIDAACDSASYSENATGYVLEAARLRWFWQQYLASSADGLLPYASPIRADARALPPAFIVTAQYDVLRDEGIAYAAHLRGAGVAVEHQHVDGQIHGFVSYLETVPAARATITHAARWAQARLSALR